MAQFDFDFYATPRRSGKLGITLLVLGLVAAIWVASNWQAVRASEAGIALQIANLSQGKPKPATPASARAGTNTYNALSQVAAQLQFSWQPAFEALDASISNKIALVSLDANQAKSQFKLVAEARQLADAVVFIDTLQQQPGVKHTELLQHEIQSTDAEKPVRFNVLVELNTGQPMSGGRAHE